MVKFVRVFRKCTKTQFKCFITVRLKLRSIVNQKYFIKTFINENFPV